MLTELKENRTHGLEQCVRMIGTREGMGSLVQQQPPATTSSREISMVATPNGSQTLVMPVSSAAGSHTAAIGRLLADH